MDQCRHCVVRGQADVCEETPCTIHEAWYVELLKTRLAEAEAQLDDLRNKLSKIETQHIHVYNSGYRAGHHDTVEGWYVDIHHSDMTSYHAEEVAELCEALAKLEEK